MYKRQPQGIVVEADPLGRAPESGRLPDESRELLCVDQVLSSLYGVTVVPGLDGHPVRPERGAQPADVGVDGGAGGGGRVAVPQQVDEALGRDDTARVQQQDRQQAPLLAAAAHQHLPSLVTGGERTEQLELHGYRAA